MNTHRKPYGTISDKGLRTFARMFYVIEGGAVEAIGMSGTVYPQAVEELVEIIMHREASLRWAMSDQDRRQIEHQLNAARSLRETVVRIRG
jgi:hypothetical protein